MSHFSESERQRERAEAALGLAMQGLDRTVRTLVDQRWIPQLRGTHKQLMEDSLTLFDRLIELKPDDPDIYVQRGQMHEALGHPDAAVADYDRAIELDPASHQAHLRLGNLYASYQNVAKRDSEKAMRHIARAAELAPHLKDYRIDHAFITAKFDYPRGLLLFEEVMRRYPNNSRAYSSRADMELEHGDYEAGLKDALKARELNPQNYEAHRHLGRALYISGRFEESLDAFEVAKKLAPYQHYVHKDRGHCLLKMGRYEEAIAEFQTGAKLAPDYYLYPHRIARAHVALGQFSQAINAAQEALEMNRSLYILTSLPSYEIARSADEKVKRRLVEVADRVIQRNKAAVNLARHAAILAEFGDLERARADLDAVAAAKDAGYYASYQAALLSLRMDDLQRYRELCQRMLKEFADSDNPSETHFTAWTCALASQAVKDYAPAIKLARHAVEKKPDSRQNLDGLGAILMRAGQYQEARVVLKKALEAPHISSTSSNHIRYFLAMTEHHLGNVETARTLLREANTAAEKELAGTPSWNRKLTLELLRKEATALIDRPPSRVPVVAPRPTPNSNS